MPYLEVNGASLYYEVVGQGTRTLLCISGADGSCEIWRAFAECLKGRFTVIMWDRMYSMPKSSELADAVEQGRGFSRSYLNGRQDYEQRLETDADDAAALIKYMSPSAPATVIGNSAGAIVALKLLVRHPSLIQTLVSYEPPLASVLPDFEELWDQHEDTYDTYRRFGIPPALEKFANVTRADQKVLVQMIDPRNGPYIFSNTQYWFEREFLYYPKAPFDVERELKPLKHKLVFVNGELSPREAYQYRANERMAELLDVELVLLPGEHVGHATHAAEFAEGLVNALQVRQPADAK